jgi:purine-binding chemotaxis protein CheW
VTEAPHPTPVGEDGSARRHTYVLFGVAGTTYAVRSDQVLHIEMIDQVTPVPNAAAAVEGVVFSRGQVVPVINLRRRFGFDRAPLDIRTRLLVVQVGTRRVGLMADDAREFIAIADEDVRPPGEAIGGLTGSYLGGVTTIGDRIVLIVDVREIVESLQTGRDESDSARGERSWQSMA